MTSLRDLIHETKRHLSSLQREPMNKLAAPLSVEDETLTFSFDTSAIQAGAYLQVGLELLYVWMVDPSSKSATVARAQMGSTATAHDAGAIVTVNPRFPDFAIAKAINDDLADLSAPVHGLYAVRTVELTTSGSSYGYDLSGATGLLEVIDIQTRLPGQPRQWAPITNYDLTRNSDDEFPSGFALSLSEGSLPGQPIRVTYKAGFSPLANLGDDVETVAGLPSRLHDLPPMGAAVALVAPREIRRNFTESQGDSRRSEEVPPGAVAGSLRPVAARRQARIAAEAGRLAQMYPERQFMPLGNVGW